MSWTTVKVSDFAEVVTGGTPSTSNNAYWESGTIPWLPSGACQNCVIDSANTFITELGLLESSAKMMPPNTVVIALTGATTGKVGLLAIDACANQSVTGILPSEKYVPTYLFHYLRSIREKVIGDSYGGAQKHISQGYVKNMEIPLPPLDIQHRIATLLDKAQSLITARREQIAVLDKLSKDLFVEMFGDPTRNPYNYSVVKMGTLGTFKNGMNYSQNESGTVIKCLGVGDFGALYSVNTATLSSISLTNMPSDGYILQNGDIVFVRSNGSKELVGRSIMIENHTGEKVTFSGFCIRLRITDSEIHPLYLNSLLHLDETRNALFRTTRGANIQNLNQQMLSALDILKPPFEKQQEYVTRIEAISRQKARLNESLSELESLYKSLTQRAFAGELIS